MLFDSIAKEQKVEYIVDSSKDVNRLALLQMKNPQKVYPIILIRDLKGIVNSYKEKNANIDKVMYSWLNYYNNKVKRYLNHLNSNYLVISYDELINNTKGTRNKIYDFIGTTPLNNDININTSNYHLVAGNPLRHSLGNIEIKKDKKWKKNLSNEDIKKATLSQNKLDPIFNA
ncbi:MAG: hypothetical protein ACOCQ4_01125 [bacterium]